MAHLARVGDPVTSSADIHGSASIPIVGNFTSGASNVFCNNIAVIRLGDTGVHVLCPGPNTFSASSGAAKTYVNNLPAVREGDSTTHCGNPLSVGHVLAGMCSPNVDIE